MGVSSIWTEKYRPQTFEDLKGQQEVVKRIKALVDQKNIPHMLFSGPAGVGKTTLALVIVKHLYKLDWKQNFLELNASDARGIDTVRNEVKDFAKTKSFSDISYKIIFLDECDALTKEAQQALRRTMETYSESCRFILSCVTPDTKILLPEEVEITIENFSKLFEKKSIKELLNIGEKELKTKKDLVLAHVSLNPKIIGKEILEIKTNTGRILKITNDHKIFTDQGWIAGKDLKEETKIIIYPSLKGVSYEDKDPEIINIEKFIEFIDSKTKTKENNHFRFLKERNKKEVIKKIKELYTLVLSKEGLTKKQYQILKKINKNDTYKSLQKATKLSYIRIHQQLSALKNKEYISIERKEIAYVNKLNKNPILIRNLRDIQNEIKKEFNIKISYKAIENITKKGLDSTVSYKIIKELSTKHLLNYIPNELEKIGAICRIVGFLLSDGHLNKKRAIFIGNKETLKNVQADLITLNYNNYSKIKSKRVISYIGKRKIEGVTTYFKLDSISFIYLMSFLGVQEGDKTTKAYNIPEFIKNGTKFMKREFLRSIFGCEASSPKCYKKNFEAIVFSQHKIKELEEGGKKYIRGISELLKDFNIENYLEIEELDYKRKKDGKMCVNIRLILNSSNNNLKKFFNYIGYAYDPKKDLSGRLAGEYLNYKEELIKDIEEKNQIVLNLRNENKSIRSIAKTVNISQDTIVNILKGQKIGLPRKLTKNFVEWQNNIIYKENLIVNTIKNIKKIQVSQVMDVMCNSDHNFITNGFISHNCNYPSKIIDPIKSRCAIFKFKPLTKEDIFELIKTIVQKENLKLDESSLELLYESSEGDVRQLQNILQSTTALSKEINKDTLSAFISSLESKDLEEVMNLAINKKFIESRKKLLDVMLNNGLSGIDIIKQMQKEVFNLKIPDEKKLEIIEKCGEIEFRLVEGSDDYIQLESLLAFMAK